MRPRSQIDSIRRKNMKSRPAIVTNTQLPKNFPDEFLVITRGNGVRLEDADGNTYIDFGAGIAVNALGYGREDLARIGYEQMQKLIHISNLYATEPQLALAKRMVASGPFAAVHLGNSGSEANEAAIKYARLYSLRKKGPGNHRLLCFTGAFHGRTMGALSVTPTPKYQEPFGPLLPGVEVCEYNNCEALERTLDRGFAAVIVETIQGEGGLDSMTRELASLLNGLCAKHDVILIADEVQTGCGRTGSFYASGLFGLAPDVITLAKPLAGGLPLSATLIPQKINDLLRVGEHGTTFGGGPVTTAVACKVWDILSDPALMARTGEKGEYLESILQKMKKRYGFLGRIKGRGLLMGIEVGCDDEVFKRIIRKAMEGGLLMLRSGANVLRFAPPLVITKEELDEGCAILENVLGLYGDGKL
jgi:acetylornithine/N-succinyldiaminopimelate aminotransferase